MPGLVCSDAEGVAAHAAGISCLSVEVGAIGRARAIFFYKTRCRLGRETADSRRAPQTFSWHMAPVWRTLSFVLFVFFLLLFLLSGADRFLFAPSPLPPPDPRPRVHLMLFASRCGPVKSDLFKSIMAKFSALAILLQSSRKSTADKDRDGPADTKEAEDIKVCSCLFSCASLLFFNVQSAPTALAS